MARSAGARVIATTRSAAKIDGLRAGGAEHVVDTAAESLAARVREITGGHGADVIFDALSGPGVEELAEAAAAGGVIRLYGYFGGIATPLPLVPFLLKGLTFASVNVFRLTADAQRLARAQRAIEDGIARRVLAPVIDRVFPFDEIVAAHEYLEANRQ